ncbi:Teneurin-a [Trichinella spiralis]|uniref:Teneurin-a n=1 Tax=Trichinella spiralis TaxID=6334 RepID=A0ABR3K226_TRISP
MMVFLLVFLSILSVTDLAEASNGTFGVYSWCGDDYKLDDNGTACIPAPKLGEPCKALCSTYNSFCVEETCKCMVGFKESNGECVQEMAAIGEDCFSDNQCSSVYSRCSNGICTCKAGFKNVNGTCMPRYYNCNTQWPDGEGDNEVTPCEVNFAEGKHTCQEGLYCQYMEMKEDLNQPVKGICCNSTAKEASNTVYCPAGICCANSCSKQRRENNGTCYFPVGVVGSACTIDAQCEINQVCKQNRCTCDVGFFEIGEQCLLPDCFFGEPLVDMTTGENVHCSQNHACSDGYYCVREYNICCKNIE